MTISIEITKVEEALLREYVKVNSTTMEGLVRKAVDEKIEDAFDLKLISEAYEEFKKNPVTYSSEEVDRSLMQDSPMILFTRADGIIISIDGE